MRALKATVLAIFIPLLLSVAHKYYVSVTLIHFVEDSKALQITSRIDFEDLEYTLQERYDPSIDMTTLDEKPSVEVYIEKYLKESIKITVDSIETPFIFIGKEYDNDQIVCYLEIEDIQAISTIEIRNMMLFEQFSKQKNVVKTKINNREDNLIFTRDDHQQSITYK